jgi:hypothetical protein
MPTRRSSRIAIATFALLLPLLAACSLTLNQSKDQCSVDGDCTSVGASLVCVAGVCTLPAGAGGSAGSGGAGGGASCATPAPSCPDNLCVPFDNCARLGICDGAALPALVAPPKP